MNGQDLLPAIRPDTGEARLWQAVIIQAIKNQGLEVVLPITERQGNRLPDRMQVGRLGSRAPESPSHGVRAPTSGRLLLGRQGAQCEHQEVHLADQKKGAHMPHWSANA